MPNKKNAVATRLRNIRKPKIGVVPDVRLVKHEVFRTPRYTYLSLFDYRPDWFTGSCYDPSAGDGRMIAELVTRGNVGPHFASDIRREEQSVMKLRLPRDTTITIDDYLTVENPPRADCWVTNPPFTLCTAFIDKALTHIDGKICIVQSLAFMGSRKRANWFRAAPLSHILMLPRRPKWEVDVGMGHSNIWDFAWYIFDRNHRGPPTVHWLPT